MVALSATAFAQSKRNQSGEKQPPAQIAQPEGGKEQSKPQQAPIVVNVAPAPKTEAERAEESEDRRKKAETDTKLADYTGQLAFFTKGLFVATVVLGIATIGLLVAAYFQSRDMKASIAVANKAANAAELNAEAAIAVELPRIGLSKITLNRTDGVVGAILGGYPPEATEPQIEFRNRGRTSAELIALCLEWAVADQLPEAPVYKTNIPYAPGVFLEPDKPFPAGLYQYVIRLQPDELTKIKAETAYLWVFGYLRYEDFMGKPHDIGFCAKWQPFDPKRRPMGFVHEANTPQAYTKKT
jgi:hypothetical protein